MEIWKEIFEILNRQKWGKESKDRQISYFGFQRVAQNMIRRLEIFGQNNLGTILFSSVRSTNFVGKYVKISISQLWSWILAFLPPRDFFSKNSPNFWIYKIGKKKKHWLQILNFSNFEVLLQLWVFVGNPLLWQYAHFSFRNFYTNETKIIEFRGILVYGN